MVFAETDGYNYNQNCGGYALGLDEWVQPFDEDFIDRLDYINTLCEDEGMSVSEAEEFILNTDADYLCNKYDLIELPSNKIIAVAPSTDLIAYRIFITLNPSFDFDYDYDFHFRVRRNGKWSEKCGCCPVSECKEELEESWDTRDYVYDSEIKYFIKRGA